MLVAVGVSIGHTGHDDVRENMLMLTPRPPGALPPFGVLGALGAIGALGALGSAKLLQALRA
eukprot:1598504-Alexandrium_andersonii.AAC.1